MPQNSEMSPAKRLGKAEALLGLEVSLTWTYDYIDLCPKTAGIEFHVEGPVGQFAISRGAKPRHPIDIANQPT